MLETDAEEESASEKEEETRNESSPPPPSVRGTSHLLIIVGLQYRGAFWTSFRLICCVFLRAWTGCFGGAWLAE